MLPSENRLKKWGEYQKVKEKGLFIRRVFFGAFVLKNIKRNPSRFGFVVSTKISGKATERNRIRRQLKEAFRFFLSQINEGLDVVILVKKSILNKSFDEIKRETETFLKEAHLLK